MSGLHHGGGPRLPTPRSRSRVAAPLALGVLGLIVIAIAAVLGTHGEHGPARPATPTPVTATPLASLAQPAPARPAPAATPAAPAKEGPSFDIVRVDPAGNAVIAGRAAPGAKVTVEANGKALGTTTANSSGDFVILPDRTLAPGTEKLTLSEQTPAGGVATGKTPVVVAIAPPKGASASTPGTLAVLAPTQGPLRVLQAPGAPVAGASAKTALGSVDYGSNGELKLAGTAPPGKTVRVYIDNKPAGDAVAGPNGRWTLTPTAPVAPGPHQLRLDQLNAGGQVTARVELPFARAAAASLTPGQVVIQPGDNLWNIARATYGSGIRYTVIYTANRGEIRNPNLIYPGQVFSLPKAAP